MSLLPLVSPLQIILLGTYALLTCRIGSGAISAQATLDSSQKLLDLLQEVSGRNEKPLGYEGPGKLLPRGLALDDVASNRDAPASW